MTLIVRPAIRVAKGIAPVAQFGQDLSIRRIADEVPKLLGARPKIVQELAIVGMLEVSGIVISPFTSLGPRGP